MSNAESHNPSPGFAKHPEHRVDIDREGRHASAEFNGVTIADSGDGVTVRESGYDPVLYFPREDVRTDLLTGTDHHTHCPFKGEASYWTLVVDGKDAENAVWSYEQPYDETMRLKGLMAFDAAKVDARIVDPG